MRQEIKEKPFAHIYAFAAVWLVWALFFPLYRLWHFLAVLALSLAAGLGFARLFPGKTIVVTVPEPEPEPTVTGDPQADAIIREGELAVAEMGKLRAHIDDPEMLKKVDEILSISRKIIQEVAQTPQSAGSVKRFMTYYLPTTIKLLNAYDRMYDQGISGENITGTMTRIHSALDGMIAAYHKQLDSLFAGQALDIETDIQVMEGFLTREGLTDSAFRSGQTD